MNKRMIQMLAILLAVVATLGFVKYRQIGERFKNTTVRTTLAKPAEVFSSDECAKLAAFCARVKLEFGELDVLRDRRSGRIYVVDVNNTPQSPPAHCSREDHARAVRALAAAFDRAFLAAGAPQPSGTVSM